jgi:ABC-2 type transport system ATP-binding protein
MSHQAQARGAQTHSTRHTMLRLALMAAATSTLLMLTGCMGGNSETSTATSSTGNTSTNTSSTTNSSGTPLTASSASGTGGFVPREPGASAVPTPYQFDVDIVSPDGTKIVATVFVPRMAAGIAVPLLLHSHGFGGSRVTTLDFDEATQTSEIDQDVMQMAYNMKTPVAGRQGWYVISYDQRGHGQSEGQVNIMDPTKEGEDYKAVLNWAEQNLPHLAYRQKEGRSDPIIGSVGRSYGGAYQLMGVGVDPRVDVILPGGTWYDLRYSLNPNNVPKSTYLNGLVAGGAQSNRGRYPDFILSGLVDTDTTGTVNANTIAILGAHGTVAYCDNGRTVSPDGLMVQRKVPAFFVQGLRDVLFNINESIANYECFHRVNPNAKMLFAKYGHSLDGLGLQEAPVVKDGKYAFNESRIWLKSAAAGCPAGQYETATARCIINVKDLMFQFLVEHLYGIEQAVSPTFLGKSPSPFPTMTAVLDAGGSDNPTAIPLPSLASVGRVKVPGNSSLSAVAGPQAVTASALSPTGLGGTPLAPLDQMGPVALFPIALAGVNVPGKCLIGTPQVLINVAAAAPAPLPAPPDPVLYVGLSLKTVNGSSTTRSLLHEQVAPVRGYGSKLVALPGISVKLGTGQSLEVLVGGFNPIFATSFSRTPSVVNVTAAASLPLPTVSTTECQ